MTIDGKTQPVCVFLIPHGSGRYEAKLVSTFDRRVPTLFQLRGRVDEAGFQFVDAIPFEAGRVVRTTDDGVVIGASLWSGGGETDRASGTVAGRNKGTFELEKIQRVSPTLGKQPPAGAVVLFNGTSLAAWRARDPNAGDARWKLVEGGAMEVHGGDIITREKFGSFRLHLEFQLPYMPEARGQGRANSGVYLQGRYEVQVLDSYGLEGEDNECGGIYQIAKPLLNMCAPPLQWQTYDITFTAPKLDAAGRKTANARATILLNGVVIHDNIELPRITGGAVDDKEGQPEGLLLQDHGNPVRYRNIWLEKLN
ncbi:MAG: DUF1080 domain-containing protein [Verrucomicrobia bacterium]|nr:DUF1080 domain-containing protein [Verrucomicrobiota bacterium]